MLSLCLGIAAPIFQSRAQSSELRDTMGEARHVEIDYMRSQLIRGISNLSLLQRILANNLAVVTTSNGFSPASHMIYFRLRIRHIP